MPSDSRYHSAAVFQTASSFDDITLLLRNAQRPGVAPPSPEYFVIQTISSRFLFAATALMNKRWSVEMSRAVACLSAALVSFGRLGLQEKWVREDFGHSS
jgi:hypothetical protein